MINRVFNILKSLNIPIEYDFRPSFDSNGMAISYHLFNESALQYGDGIPTIDGGSLQVDLFVKHNIDHSNIKKEIKQLLISNSFKGVEITTYGEEADGIGKIDHVIFKANYKE